MRNRLGESLSTVRKFDTPLEQATTPSLEALKVYSSARRETSPLAIPLFKRAVELDQILPFRTRGWASGIRQQENLVSRRTIPARHTHCAIGQASPRSISYQPSTTKKSPGTSRKPNKPASFGCRLILGPKCRILTCPVQSTRRWVDIRRWFQKPERQLV